MSKNDPKCHTQDEWQTVHTGINPPGERTTERLEVPGGWIYVYKEDYDGGVEAPPRHIRELIYVPDASRVTRDSNASRNNKVQSTNEDYDYGNNSENYIW